MCSVLLENVGDYMQGRLLIFFFNLCKSRLKIVMVFVNEWDCTQLYTVSS